MIHDKETLETAERFADSGDNESGSFLGHQLKAIRKKSYLAGVAYAREKQEPTPKDKNALSHRIRPNCEAAPWVIEAVKKIENDNSKLKAKLERAKDALRFYADPFNWQSRSGKIGAHGVWNDGGECDHPLRVCGGHKAREALKELEE